MKLLLDMNLSPLWVEALEEQGYEATHWSQVGAPGAPDREILEWARRERYLVFTHDLDFARLLALTQAEGPSVVQLRSQSWCYPMRQRLWSWPPFVNIASSWSKQSS